MTDPLMPPIRVLHVVHGLRPGGMEYGVLKIVNGLPARLIDSHICTTMTPDAGMAAQLRADVGLHVVSRRPGNDPALIVKLARLFRQVRPDIVHTHAWGTLVEGLIASRLARIPVVIHGEHGTLQLKRYQAWVQKRAWSAADYVLSVSSRLSERMASSTGFPIDRITTIRNGVDLRRFVRSTRADARHALSLSADAFVVGTVGRLVPVKDQVQLIDAVAELRQRGRPVTALIAGDGPLRMALERRAAERGVHADVQFLGHRPDVEQVLAALDVFVLSSSSEGLSNTLLEAMASGVAVVATAVGGADELIEDGRTGLLVPAGAAGPIADSIDLLAADPARRRAMAAAGRHRAETLFDHGRMIAEYTRLYTDAVRARRRSERHVRRGALPPAIRQNNDTNVRAAR